jgi:hypothetical protein
VTATSIVITRGNIAAGDDGNIDGFICQHSSTGGTGNKLIGCSSWLNSANGFNLTRAFTSVTLDSCRAFDNRYGGAAGFAATVAFEEGNGFVTEGYGSDATSHLMLQQALAEAGAFQLFSHFGKKCLIIV